jgi:hypothetical protein
MNESKQRFPSVVRSLFGILLLLVLAVTALKCSDETPNRSLTQDRSISTQPMNTGPVKPPAGQKLPSGAPVPNLWCDTCDPNPPDPPPPTPTPPYGNDKGCKAGQPCGGGSL